MRIELTFKSGEPAGWIEWDDETGEVNGPQAEGVRAWAGSAVEVGAIRIEPHPATIPATDPLRDPQQFAALIGSLFELPEELAGLYPQVEPTDADPKLIQNAVF